MGIRRLFEVEELFFRRLRRLRRLKSKSDYVQDERYIAIEHMDVRRDWLRFAQGSENRRETRLLQPLRTKNNLRNLRNLRKKKLFCSAQSAGKKLFYYE